MSESTFLPKDFSLPETSSSYLKFKEGQTKFRVVSPAVTGWEYWTKSNKPVRLKKSPKDIPSDIRDDSKIKFFMAFAVIDRADGNIKVCEVTQSTIMQAIKALSDNEDWGDPKEYDVTVNRTGQSLETVYTVQPSPHKPLTDMEKSLVENTKVNLEALFYGENPFGDFETPTEPEEPEEVKIEDVPF